MSTKRWNSTPKNSVSVIRGLGVDEFARVWVWILTDEHAPTYVRAVVVDARCRASMNKAPRWGAKTTKRNKAWRASCAVNTRSWFSGAGDGDDAGLGELTKEFLLRVDENLDEYLKDADEVVISPLANVSNRMERIRVGDVGENVWVQDNDSCPAWDKASWNFWHSRQVSRH